MKKCLYLVIVVILAVYCGNKPGGVPVQKTGSLEVAAVYGEQMTDSVTIAFDDEFLGTFINPHIVTGITAGRHKLFTSYGNLRGKSQIVTVEPGIINSITSELFADAPYTGSFAPDFSLTDIDGDSIRLSDYSGKVILLCFIDHT